MTKIAIIGAGLSGLVVVNRLQNKAEITIFEKSRAAGGRMATRYAEPYFFDHGAQFFTAKTERFIDFITPLISKGVIARWDGHFVEFEHNNIVARRDWAEEHPHYVGVPGMDAIGRYLSQDLNIQLTTRVASVEKFAEHWQLKDEQGDSLGQFDWVISTLPAEQAQQLMPVDMAITDRQMKACFSVMLGFDQPLSLGFDAALVREADISWVSVNSAKPGRDTPYCLMIHSTNQWADEHFEQDRQQSLSYLIEETSNVIGHDVSVAAYQVIHGWRYANIAKQQGDACFIDQQQQLALCGDWFIEGRIEAAFSSGSDLADNLQQMI